MKQIPEVAADFDGIAAALASAPARTHLTAAERAVVQAIPSTAKSALDVGCGDGHVACAVARRGLIVLAIDAAPEMIALARSRTEAECTIDYRIADIMHLDGPPPTFDVVFSINMVHHLPLPFVIPRLAAFVAPAGTLIIQDVVTRPGLRYLPINVVAGVWYRLQRLLHSSPATRRVQQLYDQHSRGEAYLRPDAVAAALNPFLRDVTIKHHLGWRYTAVWTRPAAT